MEIPIWSPPVELSPAEERICKRLKRTGRLFAFLRRVRHRLFDEAFQQELASVYAEVPRGAPKSPAFLAMVTLLQAYEQKSDAAAVEEAVFDARWQMVLDCLGTVEPVFSQGVLVDFRRRLIAHDMDRRLVERTVQLAQETGGFGERQLRIALDSAPLWGAARVEDTVNLVAHAAGVVVTCAARILRMKPSEVHRQARTKVLGHSSVKAALDVDWSDPAEHQVALHRLLADVARVREWVESSIPHADEEPPLRQALGLLEQVIAQDIEPDPDGHGPRIRRGVAKDRRISIRDSEMRHGRKSKSRVINGFKRHVARDLDSGLNLAVCVRPANEREHNAADKIRPQVEAYGEVAELHIDRAYLKSRWVADLERGAGTVFSRAWTVYRRGFFAKADFSIDLESSTVTCPAGHMAKVRRREAQFSRTHCGACPLRLRCTSRKLRTVQIHPQEALLLRLRQAAKTPEGRKRLRERVGVEHALAHVTRRQGLRARYLGVRKNELDMRRACVVENLHTLARAEAA